MESYSIHDFCVLISDYEHTPHPLKEDIKSRTLYLDGIIVKYTSFVKLTVFYLI